jgi:AcrR family transcriptional regulator
MKARRAYTMTARADAVVTTRDTIVGAAMQLFFDRAFEDVTLVEIARAAGVSHQTVLNHFSSKAGVATAVAEAVSAETRAIRDRAKPGDVAGAVTILVGEYERFGDANFRWAATADRLDVVSAALEVARASHRDWLEAIFGARLPPHPATRRRALHALHAATDVYTWKLLRRDLGLSRTETERTIVHLVDGIVDPQPKATTT